MSRQRPGLSIMELLVVIAVILVIGAVIVPTLSSFWADSRTRVSVDLVQARLAEARSAAVEQGRNYQVLISPDGKQIMVSTDPNEQQDVVETAATVAPYGITSTVPDTVTLTVTYAGNDVTMSQGANGWTKLITYKADGTCVEDAGELQIEEPGVTPQVVRIRGLTGAVATNAQNDPNAAPVGQGTKSP